jgi:hypothetical protein
MADRRRQHQPDRPAGPLDAPLTLVPRRAGLALSAPAVLWIRAAGTTAACRPALVPALRATRSLTSAAWSTAGASRAAATSRS